MPRENKEARQQAVAESFQWKPDASAFSVPGYDQTKQNLGAALTARQQQAGPSAQIDMAPQADVRTQQMALGQQLTQQAAGQGPSIAATTLGHALDANRNAAASFAASASGQGLSPALAASIGARSMEAANMDANRTAALGRVQEQLGAQANLGQFLTGVRGQDIGLATDQAQLSTSTALQNQAQLDDMTKFYLQLGFSYDEAQAQAQMALQQQQGQMAMQMRDINAQMAAGAANRRSANQQAYVGATAGLVGAGIGAAASGSGGGP